MVATFMLLLSSSCRTYHCRVMPQTQNQDLSKAVPETPEQNVPPTNLERKAVKAMVFVQKIVQDTNLHKGLPFVKHLVKLKQNPRVQAKLDNLHKQFGDSSEGDKDIFSDENVKWMSIGSLIAIPAVVILSYAGEYIAATAIVGALSIASGLIGLLGLIAAIAVFVVVRKNKGKYSKNTEMLAKVAFWVHMALLMLAAVALIILVIALAAFANNGNC